jgi:hypothetical protein
MGININIATKFDSAGVRSAKRELGTLKRDLSGSVSALGSNIAVLGAGIAGVTGYLAKTVNAASNFSAQFEGVNQTFGRGAKAVQDYAAQASQLSGISETAALNAAKNFGGFATSAGLSGQAAADFAIELVKAAGDLASFADVPVDEALNAIQSGLAGQTEPLRNFQILLDQTTLKNRAFDMGLTKTTDEALTPQQKVLATHVELLDQMGVKAGDFINYSGTYGNQIKSLTAEWSDMEVAIGQELLPVLEQLMPEIKDMAREFGTTLKNAVKAIDWKSLLTDLAGIATWFVNNAGRITQIATAFIVLSTAINAMRVMLDLGKISMAAFTYVQSQMAAGATIATIAVGALRAALITTGVGAVIVGLGLIANEFLFVKNETNAATGAVNDYKTATNGIRKETKTEIDNHNGDVNRLRASWSNATTVALSYRDAVTGAIVSNIPKSPTTGDASRTPDPLKPGFSYQVLQNGKWMNATWTGSKWNLEEMKYTPSPSSSTKSSGSTTSQTFQESLTLGKKQAEAQGKLQGFEFAQGYIDSLLGSKGGLRQANDLINKVTKASAEKRTKIVNRENTKFSQTIGEVNRVRAENAQLLAQQAADDAAALVASQQAEAAALLERQRVYDSFLDSVKSTFAGIKSSILGAFDLTQLGGSTNAITRNMDKMLARLRSFATNVKSLATMGLNPALLQQIISAGPMAGARLAEGLAMGGQAGLSAINAGYAEFGALSGQIAETGTQSLFGTGAQQSVYNINVDGGVGSGSTIGKAIVDAIKAYERTSGAVWQGA